MRDSVIGFPIMSELGIFIQESLRTGFTDFHRSSPFMWEVSWEGEKNQKTSLYALLIRAVKRVDFLD